MKSRLLTRLDSEIRGASSHGVADCLRCERAAYLTRRGDHDGASAELREIRARQSHRPVRPTLFAWLNLAEGLLSHCRDRDPRQARDKLVRAHALGACADLRALQALAAAWLAHMEHLRHDAAAAAERAAEAFGLAAPRDHAARARAALVVARCFDAGGRYDRAKPWYMQAHWHATEEGDDATLSALLWNQATGRVAAWRQAQAKAIDDPVQDPAECGRHALASAESAALFDRLRGVAGQHASQAVLKAQACLLSGDIPVALDLLDTHLDLAVRQGMGALEGVLLADRAWCRLLAGRTLDARFDARAAEVALARPGPHGDRAPGHSRLERFHAETGDGEARERHRDLAAERWAGHRADQLRLVCGLERAFARLPS